MIFNGSRAALINSHLEPLRHPVGEADGELLHLGHLQPLLLCLELCASFHHHLEQKKETLKNKHARIHRSETKSQSQRRKQTDSAFNHKNGAAIKRGRHPVLVSDHLFTFFFLSWNFSSSLFLCSCIYCTYMCNCMQANIGNITYIGV